MKFGLLGEQNWGAVVIIRASPMHIGPLEASPLCAVVWLLCSFGLFAQERPELAPRNGVAFRDVTANLSRDEKSLIEEYRANYARLRTAYGNAQIDAVRRYSDWPALRADDNPEGKAVERLSFSSRDGVHFRMEAEELDKDTERPTGSLKILLSGSQGNITASRRGKDQPLVIVGASSADDLQADMSSYVFHSCPFSYYVFPMAWLLFDKPWFAKSWTIESIVAGQEGDQRVVHVVASGILQDDKFQRAKFTFWRDQAWALKEYAFGHDPISSPRDYVRKGKFQYEGNHNGVPLLKRMEVWKEQGPEQKRAVVELYEIVRFIPEPPDASVFSPASLRLAVGRVRINWWPALLMFSLGAALVAIYVMLKRSAARKR